MASRLFFGVFAITAAIAAFAASQEASGATKKRVRPVAPTKAKPKPTEVLAVQLVVNSLQDGDSIGAVCDRGSFKNLAIALNMNEGILVSAKGEFETSQEYASRSERLSTVLNSNPVVICEPLDDNPDIRFSYDADGGFYKGSFQTSHNVWRDVKQLGSYRSRTRMGVSATVRSSLEMEYNIDLELPYEMKGCLVGSYSSYSFNAHVSRDLAPAVKRMGRLAIVGRLESPYIESKDTPGKPSLDDPYDIYTSALTVHVRPEKFVLLGPDRSVIWSCIPGRLVPSQTPTLIGDASELIQFYDLPTNAYIDRRSFTAILSLSVTTRGDVADCKVVKSSGTGELDAAACTAVKKRAKFTPAANAEGEPIASSYVTNVGWKPRY